MKYRTNQIMFVCMALCLLILACQYSPLEKSNETDNPPESKKDTGTVKTMLDGITSIFGQTKGGIIIGGIEPQGFELVGQLGGSAMAVYVKDDLAVMGQGPRVVTLDISKPESVVLLGESDVLPGLVMGLKLWTIMLMQPVCMAGFMCWIFAIRIRSGKLVRLLQNTRV